MKLVNLQSVDDVTLETEPPTSAYQVHFIDADDWIEDNELSRNDIPDIPSSSVPRLEIDTGDTTPPLSSPSPQRSRRRKRRHHLRQRQEALTTSNVEDDSNAPSPSTPSQVLMHAYIVNIDK